MNSTKSSGTHGHFAFAPGAIERHKASLLGTPQQRRELVRWVKGGALWIACSGVAALAAGVIVGVLP